MIDPRELRIGNWVRQPADVISTVRYPLDEFQFDIDDFEMLSTEYRGYSVNMIEPIPLTEEWLIKFGFKIHLGWDAAKVWRLPNFNFDSFEIQESAQGYLSPNDKPLKYVHTLQNAFYFYELTGKELEIR